MTATRTLSLVALTLLGTTALASAGPIAGAAGSPTGVHLDPSLPIHPALQYGAQVEPDKKVRVIVQKASADADAHAIARGAGATLDEEFPFIKSVVLEVPQRAVLALAHDPHVRYISPNGPLVHHSIDASHLLTTYPGAISVPQGVWNGSIPSTGNGVTVAVLDTGVNGTLADFGGRVTMVNVNKKTTSAGDGYGHGTHVAGIIDGKSSKGTYIGIAPDAKVVSVKIADDSGNATDADMLRGLQWVYDNRASYNIRAVNISSSSGTAASYLTSPLAAAAEQLWFNGVTVVVAAGNSGAAINAAYYPPANDPYVITVGCLDDNWTTGPGDDSLCTFSSRGTSQDGIYKPDLVAPGRRIYSVLASKTSVLGQQFSSRISADGAHIRLSGTSMAAPVVTGVVADILQVYPTMTPDQLKWLLLKTANPYNAPPDKAGVVDPQQSLTTAKSTSPWGVANVGNIPNTGVNMTNGTVQWGTYYWDTYYWDTYYWDTYYWDVTSYD